jgi:hypothetical protein
MVNPIGTLPRDILGQIFLNLDDAEDLTACSAVCTTWNETIAQNYISKFLITNIFPDVNIKGISDNNYPELFRALTLSLQTQSNIPIETTPLIDDLQEIASRLDKIARLCGMHCKNDEFDHAICPKVKELPREIQDKIYNRLEKTWENNIPYHFPNWGETVFHSLDHRRSLPLCATRRDVISRCIAEVKLRDIAGTLMRDPSERKQKKAIQQFLKLAAPELKNGIYQKLGELLLRKNLFNHASGEAAFYDPNVPSVYKGAAINCHLNNA